MTTDLNFYRVGGCVRDEILGRRSKDIDYAVEAPSFAAMEAYIAEHGRIYLSKPEFLTIRAKLDGEDRDFVLCRKDGPYSDARHPDSVELGDIYDDLARRDFTMNAIAIRETNGSVVDPHNGREDIENGIIRTVGCADERFNEDALRLLRAMRFHFTLGFALHADIIVCLRDHKLLSKLASVSVDRMQAELSKCMAKDTLGTLMFLGEFSRLREHLFGNSRLWLEPTLKERPV